MANLESLVSVQQSLIASQNEKLKAQDKKIDDLIANWNDSSDSSRQRKAMQDSLEDDDEDDHLLFAAAESPAEGALRGVNEVIRFVQALDKVDVEGFEPMWTVLDDER